MQSERDEQLVLQLKKNELKAFDALFQKYSEKLYRLSFSLLKSEDDSRDIIQEAFLRIWERRDTIDTSKSFKSFLFSISYNLIIDQLRLRLKDKEYRQFLVKFFDSDKYNLADELNYEDLVVQVRKAVDDLPSKRKQIYLLSREVGLTHKEISERLGISVKTVENQITLALKYIRTKLGKDLFPVILFIYLFG